MNKIKILNGRFEQIIDPVYKTPERTSGISAHFFSSIKPIPGTPFFASTFAVNIAVIWLMSVFCAVALYYDSLKKLTPDDIKIISSDTIYRTENE